MTSVVRSGCPWTCGCMERAASASISSIHSPIDRRIYIWLAYLLLGRESLNPGHCTPCVMPLGQQAAKRRRQEKRSALSLSIAVRRVSGFRRDGGLPQITSPQVHLIDLQENGTIHRIESNPFIESKTHWCVHINLFARRPMKRDDRRVSRLQRAASQRCCRLLRPRLPTTPPMAIWPRTPSRFRHLRVNKTTVTSRLNPHFSIAFPPAATQAASDSASQRAPGRACIIPLASSLTQVVRGAL